MVTLAAGAEMKKTMRQLDKWAEKKKRQVRLEVERSAVRMEGDMARNAPVFEGTLRSSIKITRRDKGFTALVGSILKYALSIEYGMRPGVVFLPWTYGPLRRWVEKVLGVRGKRTSQVTFFVARKIFKKGFPAHPFMRPAFRKEKPKFQRAIFKIMKAA